MKNFKILMLFVLVFSFCLIKQVKAAEHKAVEVSYSQVGGLININSPELYAQLTGKKQPRLVTRYFNFLDDYLDFVMGMVPRPFRPIPPPQTISFLVGEDEYPGIISATIDEPNKVAITGAYLNFYDHAPADYFPLTVRIDGAEKIITITGMDFGE